MEHYLYSNFLREQLGKEKQSQGKCKYLETDQCHQTASFDIQYKVYVCMEEVDF
jgi:ribosomal protein S26